MGVSSLDFSTFAPANHLWQRLVERLGLDKAQCAVHQALDLQGMHGNVGTLPVLIFETSFWTSSLAKSGNIKLERFFP